MYHLATIAVGCIVQPQPNEKPNCRNFCISSFFYTSMPSVWVQWLCDHGYSRCGILAIQFCSYTICHKGKKAKAVDLYSASSCTPKAGGQAGGPAVKPPLMRSRHGPELLGTQATAHSLHTQAWAATWPLARQRQSAVGLHLRNPSLMDYYSFNRPRRDGRLSRPCWLTDSGHFTHKVVTRPAVSLAQG